MNQTLEVIQARRSLRAYAARPVEQTEKEKILQAAFRAPTAGNMMLYSIIEVEDQALKDRLSETCDHQPFIARAPYVLLFLADYQRWFDYFIQCGVKERCQELGIPFRTPGAGDVMLACCDALIAAQNAVIAAESLGLGSCYIGDILENYEIHRELFNLPRYTLPITMLCFGYPVSERPAANPTTRFDREFIAYKNTYHRLSPEEMERMFAPMQERYYPTGNYYPGAQNLGQSNYLRKFSAEFSIEMNRSVQEMLKNWQDDGAE
jgi:FMN reductase (NADPH)/FMN reductase [NAD(P)H]